MPGLEPAARRGWGGAGPAGQAPGQETGTEPREAPGARDGPARLGERSQRGGEALGSPAGGQRATPRLCGGATLGLFQQQRL